MKLSVSKLYKQFIEFYKKLSKKTKIIAFSVLSVVIIGSVVLGIVFNKTKYTALYSGLSSAESSQILTYLQSKAVSTQVQSDGTILVPEEQVATLKMELASEGYPKSTLNYDLFMNQANLFTTDYERKKLLLFQLQNRLQDSIKTLQGVSNAIVTLSIPEENSYVLKDEIVNTTASVVLELETGTTLTSKQIKGVENLVSNSVPGLESKNVSILTSDMEPLNGEDTTQNGNDASSKADTINRINNLFEKNIKEFLKPVFGDNGVSVSVNVKVDFNKTSSKETSYTPVVGDDGIISWVQRSGSSDGAGDTSTAGGTAGTGSNTKIPTYEESDSTSNDTSGTKSNSKTDGDFSANYLVNQLVKEIEDSGGNITDMTVAVVLNKKELSDDSKKQYRELVAYGAGISVEKVVVSNAEFFTASETENSKVQNSFLPVALSAEKLPLILGAVAGIIILIILIRVLAKALKKVNQRRLLVKQERLEKKLKQKELKNELKAKKEAKKEPKKGEEQEISIEQALSEDGNNTEMNNSKAVKKPKIENMPEEIVLNETREQALKRQIKEFSGNNPEMVAQLLRIWIKEDENK